MEQVNQFKQVNFITGLDKIHSSSAGFSEAKYAIYLLRQIKEISDSLLLEFRHVHCDSFKKVAVASKLANAQEYLDEIGSHISRLGRLEL